MDAIQTVIEAGAEVTNVIVNVFGSISLATILALFVLMLKKEIQHRAHSKARNEARQKKELEASANTGHKFSSDLKGYFEPPKFKNDFRSAEDFAVDHDETPTGSIYVDFNKEFPRDLAGDPNATRVDKEDYPDDPAITFQSKFTKDFYDPNKTNYDLYSDFYTIGDLHRDTQ